MTRSVCALTSPLSSSPVAGSSATWPEQNTMPSALMACEYGPMACGASLVAIFSLMASPGSKKARILINQNPCLSAEIRGQSESVRRAVGDQVVVLAPEGLGNMAVPADRLVALEELGQLR